MRHPNAYYLGDVVKVDLGLPSKQDAEIVAFVQPRGGRQLVRLAYADGSERLCPFGALHP